MYPRREAKRVKPVLLQDGKMANAFLLMAKIAQPFLPMAKMAIPKPIPKPIPILCHLTMAREIHAARFTPPTDDDVAAYVSEKGYHVNAERFVSFYQQKGWMVGKNRMKDWKAAVRNWETRWKNDHGAVSKASGNVFLEMLEERQ